MSTATTDHPPPQEPAAARLQNMATPPPRPSELEHLPCPRCDSTNTKFCYYNNYNLSQPRHFCKSCRRYWTRGGTLRNVPVGGGSRKSSATNKRPRSTPSASTPTAAAAATSSSSSSSSTDLAPPKSVVVKAENDYGPSLWGGAVNLNEVAVGDLGSLLRAQQQQGGGFVPMANFGFGFGLGLGSGFGTWDWPTEQVGGEVDVGGGEENVSGGAATGCNTWQLACVESGLPEVEGDCYGLPDLAISAPGQSLFK